MDSDMVMDTVIMDMVGGARHFIIRPAGEVGMEGPGLTDSTGAIFTCTIIFMSTTQIMFTGIVGVSQATVTIVQEELLQGQ